jgi:hypothetical protein
MIRRCSCCHAGNQYPLKPGVVFQRYFVRDAHKGADKG